MARRIVNDVGHAVDTALDRSIVLGYGRVGLWVRRRLPGWPGNPPRMDGRAALVTGAGSGLGLATSVALARLGARVLAVARDEDRARRAAERISAQAPGAEVRPLACDVSALRELRALVGAIAGSERRLDVLVHNAGVMPARRTRSADGHELMFATHVLASFALIAWARELLERSAPARVINVSSGGMYTAAIPCDDLESERRPYDPARLYATTKREQVVITEQWGRRLAGSGVAVHAMHPGWADTPGVRRSMPRFSVATRPIIRTPEQGADTIVWLAAAEEPLRSLPGAFWHDRKRRPARYALGAPAESEACRARLWDYCESIVNAVAG